jgi:hypothetical protein
MHSTHRELCPGAFDSSIRPPVHPQSVMMSSAPAKSSSPVSPSTIAVHEAFYSSFSRPCMASLSLPSPSPVVVPLPLRFPPRRRCPRPRTPRPCVCPSPQLLSRPARPMRRLAQPPVRAPPPLPLPWMRERRWREEEEGYFPKLPPYAGI